ncbi:MAG: hypothetical protein FWF06_07035, partial [Symbiobacteriaceae bacterium]|nr:hypothetical protein [Symbiobacteriaceae bacterium]
MSKTPFTVILSRARIIIPLFEGEYDHPARYSPPMLNDHPALRAPLQGGEYNHPALRAPLQGGEY